MVWQLPAAATCATIESNYLLETGTPHWFPAVLASTHELWSTFRRSFEPIWTTEHSINGFETVMGSQDRSLWSKWSCCTFDEIEWSWAATIRTAKRPWIFSSICRYRKASLSVWKDVSSDGLNSSSKCRDVVRMKIRSCPWNSWNFRSWWTRANAWRQTESRNQPVNAWMLGKKDLYICFRLSATAFMITANPKTK